MLFYSYVLDYQIMVFRECLKLRYFDREKTDSRRVSYVTGQRFVELAEHKCYVFYIEIYRK